MPDHHKYYLRDVRGELRARVLDLCVHRLWHDARDLLHQNGFQQYTLDDVINFYNWAPTNLEDPAPPLPAPEPQSNVSSSAPPAEGAPVPLPEIPHSANQTEPAANIPSQPESAPGAVANGEPAAADAVPAAAEASTPDPLTARKRRGKVARLPKNIRDELNTRLENGESYEIIIRWLARKGHRGFKKQNLHHWKEGGYQDWRRENERIDNQAMQREWLTEQIAKTQPGELFVLIDQLFVSQLLDSLFGLDTAQMKQGLAGNPRHFIALFNAFNRYKRQAMDTPEFQEFLRRQKERKNRKKRGLSPEVLREIEEILGIRRPILGVKPDPNSEPPSTGGVKDSQT